MCPPNFKELLRNLRPQLRYDPQETYKADSASTIADNYHAEGSNRLENHDSGQIFAEADPVLPSANLYLNYLGRTYPNGTQATGPREEKPYGGDVLDEVNSYSEDAQRMHLQDRYRDQIYGRIVRTSASTAFLQYWFFYYYNEGILGFGDHEADWEMIQIRLNVAGSAASPAAATYARHGTADAHTCDWNEVRKWSSPDGSAVPIVYVELGGHGSVFSNPNGLDENGEDVWPSMEELVPWYQPWVYWPGRWGGSEDVIRSPGLQGLKWEDPLGFEQQAQSCPVGGFFSGSSRESSSTPKDGIALRSDPTLPTPTLRARREGEFVTLHVAGIPESDDSRTRVILTAHAGDPSALPSGQSIRPSGSAMTRRIRLPLGGGPYRVKASVATHEGKRSPLTEAIVP